MVASGNHWLPYKPVQSEDIRYLWDGAIARRRRIERNHFCEAKLAVGIQTGVRAEDPEVLVAEMDQYCTAEEVVAAGDIGVRQSQQVAAWDIDDELDIIEAQMDVAESHDLPVILHTPTRLRSTGRYRPGFSAHGYERNPSLSQEPVYDAENPELEAVRYDIEAANRAGLDESQVVASHADPNNLEYLMEETDCYVSFTVGAPWLTGVSAATVAEAIHEYGPERIMIDTDCANVLRSDPFSIKRAMLELYRLGIDESDIRTVVADTPRDVFDLNA
jgi:predicted metal-dependent TIM-barrel fold hydrolase